MLDRRCHSPSLDVLCSKALSISQNRKKYFARRFDEGLCVEVVLFVLAWIVDVRRDPSSSPMTGPATVHAIPLVFDLLPPNYPNPHSTLSDPF